MRRKDAALILEDGKCFLGKLIGKKDKCIGEVCFTTSMTGYQHIITDPSFANQIIVFTFPHIGNVGINCKDNEGEKIFASGVVVRDLSPMSHSSSYITLNNWLEKNNVVVISEVDTRALTRYLRKYGVQNGIICSSNEVHVLDELMEYKFLNGMEMTDKVSLHSKLKSNFNAKYKVVIVDFGIKLSIVSRLIELDCAIELVKPDMGFAERILNLNPDGVLLSNGPGDPQKIGGSVISEINIILKSKMPVFGICLGHQLLSIALGAKTIKMDVGHRGSNHPVYDLWSGKVEITSQNHGFVVDLASLPNNVEVTHVSLFDNSVEGIMIKDHLVFSVQFHPEEAPGTHDSHHLFRRFIKNIILYKKRKQSK